ncbi:hypothetical protein HMPREF9413_0308 [Paenibacillus sp. HGF7]|nr:hypothetical protein HMPREF9413_0308 [Paenibacillus sp. HGF7]
MAFTHFLIFFSMSSVSAIHTFGSGRPGASYEAAAPYGASTFGLP